MATIAIKAGHHQFHQHFISDHKGVYIHFKANDLFDNQKIDRSQASYRRLRLGRRHIVEKYITRLEELYETHKILERTKVLAEAIRKQVQINDKGERNKLTQLFKKLDRLDEERVQYMQAAENHAGRPQPNGIYEWSPLLESSGQRVTYWKLILNMRRVDRRDSHRIQRMKLELEIMDTGVNYKLYIKNNLSQAWQALRKVEQQDK